MEPEPDWTYFENLRLDLANPSDRPLRMGLRVHDRQHNLEFDDRFNTVFTLKPRSQTQLSVPLSDLPTAPKSRSMDLRHIAGIIIFGDEKIAEERLLLPKIWLD